MKKTVSFFVPGRLCLFGEHSDWAGEFRRDDPSVDEGRCIVAGTEQGVFAEAEISQAGFSISQIMETGSFSDELTFRTGSDALKAARTPGNFHGYAAGTASLILQEFPGRGIRMRIFRRTLPLKKGLSSSAAVCVATARAFNRIHDLGLTVQEEMDLAYRGELLTGSSCGRMDQVCALGGEPVLLTFSGEKMGIMEIEHPEAVHLLLVDLRRQKNTKKILSDLHRAFVSGNEGIREALGRENHRIADLAVNALEAGRGEELGKLMTEAQSIFDSMVAPCCPEELSAPVLHRVLELGADTGMVWGGKGVGSQGDGTAQFICRGLEEREELKNILEAGNRYTCYFLTL